MQRSSPRPSGTPQHEGNIIPTFDISFFISASFPPPPSATPRLRGMKRAHPALRAPLNTRGMKLVDCTPSGSEETHPVTLRVPPLYTREISFLHLTFHSLFNVFPTPAIGDPSSEGNEEVY